MAASFMDMEFATERRRRALLLKTLQGQLPADAEQVQLDFPKDSPARVSMYAVCKGVGPIFASIRATRDGLWEVDAPGPYLAVSDLHRAVTTAIAQVAAACKR